MFGKAVDDQIMEWALTTDEEICGVIVDNAPVLIKNAFSNPKEGFLINEIPDNAQAVFHSHPNGPFHPSKLDMEQQIAIDLPWAVICYSRKIQKVIWFGDDVPKAPLVGRGFIYGVQDCYSLIKDFYKEIHDVSIPDFPRNWDFWNLGERDYEDGYPKAGFSEIPHEEIRPGDVIFFRVRSKVSNHGAIYLGNNLMLHHLGTNKPYDPSKLSVVEPVTRWSQFISRVVTHENDTIDRKVGQGIR